MYNLEEIARATAGRVVGSGALRVRAVSTDTRKVTPGELFIALKGERFDGHAFIADAAKAGITAFLVEESWLAGKSIPEGCSAVVVQDSLRGLGDLAAWHRRRFRIPVVGVTGSNGKTTTKEMLSSILGESVPGLKTQGNLNNLIGLPLMLLQLTARHRWAVLEMGMSEFGEIDRLAEIALPDVGIITNAFPAHLETLGSVEGVAKAKGELFLRLQPGGWAVYNVDDPLISRCLTPPGVKSLSFGLRGAEVSSASIQSLGKAGESFTLRLPEREFPVRLKAFGKHNVYNALAAAAAAYALGIDPEQIRRGLEDFTPVDKRFLLEEHGDVVLIDDSYNANPASMAAALDTVREIGCKGRIAAVLGDMLELGAGTEEAHRDLGKLASRSVDRLYILGDMAAHVSEGARAGGAAPGDVVVATDHEELIAALLDWVRPGDCILVKGSRGMKMERVAQAVRERFAPKPQGGRD